VVIIGGPAVFVLALLNPHPTALAWIEAALSAFLVAYAGYLVIRRRRRESAPRD
jgi:membrane protein implicated in regulation of membrane protease activity